MADRETLLALAERCEALTKDDDGTDIRIAQAIGASTYPEERRWYTGSIDDALALVPEGWVPAIQWLCEGAGAVTEIYRCGNAFTVRSRAATPALSFAAAALRARAQETPR